MLFSGSLVLFLCSNKPNQTVVCNILNGILRVSEVETENDVCKDNSLKISSQIMQTTCILAGNQKLK